MNHPVNIQSHNHGEHSGRLAGEVGDQLKAVFQALPRWRRAKADPDRLGGLADRECVTGDNAYACRAQAGCQFAPRPVAGERKPGVKGMAGGDQTVRAEGSVAKIGGSQR